MKLAVFFMAAVIAVQMWALYLLNSWILLLVCMIPIALEAVVYWKLLRAMNGDTKALAFIRGVGSVLDIFPRK